MRMRLIGRWEWGERATEWEDSVGAAGRQDGKILRRKWCDRKGRWAGDGKGRCGSDRLGRWERGERATDEED